MCVCACMHACVFVRARTYMHVCVCVHCVYLHACVHVKKSHRSLLPPSQCSSLQQSLLWSLSVLECMEVGVEVSCEMVFSEAGKWGVVILMQIVK